MKKKTPNEARLEQILAPFSQMAMRAGSGTRWCQLASVDAQGQPQIRTVILRQFDHAARQMLFYTDKRSPKCSELISQPNVCCHFLTRAHKQQYRFSGQARLLTDGPLWQSHWEALKPAALREYNGLSAPGTKGETEYLDGQAKDNFALLCVGFERLDYLCLSETAEAHERVQIHWQKSGRVQLDTIVP